MTSFIHKISKFQGRLSIKISGMSMGPRCAPTLILAVLQTSNSQSEKPILKSSWHLTACRYHAFFFMKQDRKDWRIPGILGEVFPSMIFSHSKLGIPFTSGQKGTLYDMTTPDGAAISSVRPNTSLHGSPVMDRPHPYSRAGGKSGTKYSPKVCLKGCQKGSE